jgi:hypothetical protein
MLVVVSFLYTGSIVVLVGIELDELLREDAAAAERTIASLVHDVVRD